MKKLSEQFASKSVNELTDEEVNEGYTMIEVVLKKLREQAKEENNKN